MYSACLYIVLIHFLVNKFTEVFAIYAVKGSAAQLLCPITRSVSLTWTFKTTAASSITTYAYNERISVYLSDDLKQRLKVTGSHDIGRYHLNISNIKESDQGIYQCYDTSNSLSIHTEYLTVIVGPSAVNLDNVIPDNKIPGIEGQDMTIICTAAGGQPPPDVKLVILGTTYTGKQSKQHTFNPQRSVDGSNVTCLAGYEEINSYPVSTSANIYLMLKPDITPNSPSTLSIEELQSFEVPCHSTGSRPAASMYWLLGQQRIDVTLNSSTQSIPDPSTDTYNVTSTLRYRIDRRYNRQTLICRAVNVAGSIERSLALDVKYAPGVSVENRTLSHTQSLRQIQSAIDSNPQVNNCKWLHRSKYGELIRQFSENNKILTLPTVPKDKEYQDTGEYTCTAENGIVGINGQLKQNGSGYITSNASPVITADNKDNSIQYGTNGESTKIYVNVYSIPKYFRISWYIGDTQLVPNKYVITEEPAKVKDVFHGVEVQLDGYRIALTINDIQEADFTNYTQRLYYGSQYAEFEVTLQFASAPDTPSNFSITSSGETSITVQWISGYDGGHTQFFFVEYRISGTDTWTSQKVRTSIQFNTYNDYTLSELLDKTTYELRMYAENRFNQSQRTYTETSTTLKIEAQTSSVSIIGGVAGMIIVLLVVCVVIVSLVILKRRKGRSSTEKHAAYYENSGDKKDQIGNEYKEVANTSGMQHTQCSKTYATLGATYDDGDVGVYEDLHNSKGKTLSKIQGDNYEELSAQDKPILYDELNKEKGKTEEVYVNEVL